MAGRRSGVTLPEGFLAAGVDAGVKRFGRKDIGLIYSTVPAVAVGVLTTNRIVAAPVVLMREQLRGGEARAIIANSGNANCCTGAGGLRDARETAREVAKLLRVPERQVLVASTGVIGRRLPMPRILRSLPLLVGSLHRGGGADVAHAIMTTDTVSKEASAVVRLGRRVIRIGAVAKGSGMVQPHMATMLAFITTDAPLTRQAAQRALRLAVDRTFNRITVDGDTSTNDAVILMANGLAGGAKVGASGSVFERFAQALETVCRQLAQMIARDGEGATRLIEVAVEGARTPQEADRVARRVANSPLVKTMVTGGDPNWGRLAAAVGSSDVPVDPERLVIRCESGRRGGDGLAVFRRGMVLPTDRSIGRRLLQETVVRFRIQLRAGRCETVMWTCDLTEGYIRINAKYST